MGQRQLINSIRYIEIYSKLWIIIIVVGDVLKNIVFRHGRMPNIMWKKGAEIKREQNRSGEAPGTSKILTDFEEMILALIGQSY